MSCKHQGASNTRETILAFKGEELVGVLKGQFPTQNREIASRTMTLVFESGCGLTISHNGAYWHDTREDVARVVTKLRKELEAGQADIEFYLERAAEGAEDDEDVVARLHGEPDRPAKQWGPLHEVSELHD
ncbi:MAG TPA: hypothetical protein VMV23_09280 [Candidatus Nanopelagicaceae bacterium]|nr:hypothetical protein [Candidatus Nanopelagicaceae bacterium]